MKKCIFMPVTLSLAPAGQSHTIWVGTTVVDRTPS